MADAVDERDAAGLLDRRAARPSSPARRRGPSPPGSFSSIASREERGHEVARDELARVVDEEAAVGVAVEGDPEVGALGRASRSTMNSRFSGSSGFGSWFGNVPSGSKKQRTTSSCGSRSSTGGSIAPAIPFAASTTIRSGRIDVGVDEREHLATKPSQMSVGVTSPRRATSPNPASAARRTSSRPESPPTGSAPRADDLHPGVLLRVVRRGDDDAALEVELADGVVEHLGADHPEVEHVGAAVRRAVDHGGRHRRAR